MKRRKRAKWRKGVEEDKMEEREEEGEMDSSK